MLVAVSRDASALNLRFSKPFSAVEMIQKLSDDEMDEDWQDPTRLSLCFVSFRIRNVAFLSPAQMRNSFSRFEGPRLKYSPDLEMLAQRSTFGNLPDGRRDQDQAMDLSAAIYFAKILHNTEPARGRGGGGVL